MADVTIRLNQVTSGKVKLTADQVTTVNVEGFSNLEIIADGADELWFCDGRQTPSVGAKHCWYLPAGTVVIDERGGLRGSASVGFISPGTPTIVVQRA